MLRLCNERLYEKICKMSSLSIDRLKMEYARAEYRANSGKLKKRGFISSARRLLDQREYVSDREMEQLLSLQWIGPAEDVMNIKERVHRAGHVVGIFSNISFDSLKILSQKYPLMYETYGGPHFYSCEAGAIKPSRPIYDNAESFRRTNGIGSIVLIDDNAANIKTAIEEPYLWKGIVFEKYIDKSEAGRLLKPHDVELSGENLRRAKTAEELVETLNEFGIRI